MTDLKQRGVRSSEFGVERKAKNMLLLALFFFAAYSPFMQTQRAYSQTVDEAVTAVEQHYQGLNDLTAKVVQKNFLKSIDKTQTFDGVLRIKKPGKLRLEFSNGQLIVVNGKEALFYSKKSEQVIKKKFTDFEQMNIPVAFLLGAAHIRDDFDVLQPDVKKPRELELIPKKPGAAMKKLVLVSTQNGAITGMTIHDKSGNVTDLTFTDTHENTGVDDKVFSFKPPKGTEIIEQ